MEASERKPMTAGEHALEASRLASAIQPASDRFAEIMSDPMRRTEAVAMGRVEAHNASIDFTLRKAELHARVADVLLRTEALDCLLRHTER